MTTEESGTPSGGPAFVFQAMRRHEEWRRYPGDPRRTLGWTLRAIIEETPRVVVMTLAALVGAFMLIASAAAGAFCWPDGLDLSFDSLRCRAPRDLALLLPIPSDVEGFPVRVTLRAKGVRTGYDEGIVSFVGGWLCFEGRRTAFALRPDDVFAHLGSKVDLDDGTEIAFEPYDRLEARRDLASGFDVLYRRWRIAVSPEGESRLPPRTVHPWAVGRALGAIVIGGLLVAAAIPVAFVGLLATKAGAAVVALCGAWRLVRGVIDVGRIRAYSSS